MSLSNEQLLYLSALAYYNVDTVDVSNKNVKNIINGVRKGEKTTCFDGAAGYIWQANAEPNGALDAVSQAGRRA